MGINWNEAVKAGKAAREDAFQNCVEEVRSNANLFLLMVAGYKNGFIDEQIYNQFMEYDTEDKLTIHRNYANLIYPNTILGIVEQILCQKNNWLDWPE